ncbi:LLM class flavin-dependent oxidoreductase [Bailinhaonella thermotolerans]|uniref:LLM class flavin-dependent oxidoreductase n=1 Tax=Bailinhaonella thermotolerans TaxID=1070861 RepID=A0A3A4BBW3_9ACTN|nr:LLM class flavin-dependent oxidoreductase [Bailinhaonella thermotolerans]RJL35586.1 LLM class flavin-dependent oxidoreductase [Bailinhaonella thermotolerans]
MQLGVNVPNFGPGTDPGVLREWAGVVEGLGFDLLMMSDHVVITPEVAQRYPEPFYEPLTTLSWLAGITTRVRLGTTVLVLPYRHPLLVARMAANLHQLSGGRFVLGVGVGWSRQEFEALGVPFAERGKLTEEYLSVLRENSSVPIWVGGNGAVAIRRAERYGDAYHPLRNTMPWLREAREKCRGTAFAPRIALRLTAEPVTDPERLAGVGTLEQVLDDLGRLRELGAETVLLDPYNADPEETRRPEAAWRALTAVMTHWRTAS